MDTKNVPVTFWHAVSICMLVATFVMLKIAWKSDSVTLSFANAKVELANQIEEVAKEEVILAHERNDIESALMIVETMHTDCQAQSSDLERQRQALQASVAQLDQERVLLREQVKKLPQGQRPVLPDLHKPIRVVVPSEFAPHIRSEQLEINILRARESLQRPDRANIKPIRTPQRGGPRR